MSSSEQLDQSIREEVSPRDRARQALVNITLTIAGCALYEDIHHPGALATAALVAAVATTGLELKYI